MYTLGTRTALPIIFSLRNKGVLSSIADNDTDNIQEPTSNQVNKYLLNTLKPKIQQKSHINYGERMGANTYSDAYRRA